MYDADPSQANTGWEDDVDELVSPDSGVRRKKILLAEDDAEMRSMLAAVLRSSGFEVLEAGDGAELTKALDTIALRMLERNELPDIDLIISDINMPGTTGIEVLARMRRAQMEMPVILMTAFGDHQIHAEADRLGVEMVLDKPFALRDLLAAVQAVPDRAA
jgi:DNA-binding response OmpR family regulator